MVSPPSLAGVFHSRNIEAVVGGVGLLKLVGASGTAANARGKAPTETEETKKKNMTMDKILRDKYNLIKEILVHIFILYIYTHSDNHVMPHGIFLICFNAKLICQWLVPCVKLRCLSNELIPLFLT